jgi:NADH-quinone oxidoreductase subunit N
VQCVQGVQGVQGVQAGGRGEEQQGVQGVLVYMAIYLVMTLGTFAGILSMRVGDTYVEKISDLSGLARTNGPMAFFLAAMMLSLAGIPPLAGFFAKWYVFNAAIQANLYPLAVISVLSSVVACFYYLRIVKVMYFDEAAAKFARPSMAVSAVLMFASLLIVLFSFWPAPLDAAAAAAAKSLF